MGALGETISRVLLAVGFATPVPVAVVVSVMLVATVTVHLSKGSSCRATGYEYTVALTAAARLLHSPDRDRSRSMPW